MILGLSLSHDASAAITDSNGVVKYAIGEERITRVKNYMGIPKESIKRLMEIDGGAKSLAKVIIGSHEHLDLGSAQRMLAQHDDNPSNPFGKMMQLRPGYKLNSSKYLSSRNLIENYISEVLFECGVQSEEYIWENHHYSHLGCALGASSKSPSLLISFDGNGDGESAAIAIGAERKIQKKLTSISQLDSLGNLYTAVTSRYNFKPIQHEGKITGLAAFGEYSTAVDFLLNNLEVSQGKVSIKYSKSIIKTKLIAGIRTLGLGKKVKISLEEIVAMAESQTENYADLAFAVQYVLESAIIEIVDYWIRKTGIAELSLAGGVFANVKLNQRLSEMNNVNSVNVFPNMGDGGLSLGGIWRNLSKSGILSESHLYENMFLGPINDGDGYINNDNFSYEILESQEVAQRAAKDISEGKLVALHQGKMEFGPRALGNRSLLLDPRNKDIQLTANRRLLRTEFMPFAPIVLEHEFANFFYTKNSTLEPFYYMTMTCMVKETKRELIPAVTHVDGTARPQIVSKKTNKLCSEILEAFNKLTNLPVLVNTSLNVHEEPINYGLSDTLKCLEHGIIDVIYTESYRITKLT